MLTPFKNKTNTESNLLGGNRSLWIKQMLLFQVANLAAPNLSLELKNKTTSQKVSAVV